MEVTKLYDMTEIVRYLFIILIMNIFITQSVHVTIFAVNLFALLTKHNGQY